MGDLIDAAADGNVKRVKTLIAEGTYNVNKRIPNGKTALSLASEGGFKEIVALLIAAGANVDNTPLIYATRDGNKEIVKMLIAAGANVNYEGTGYGTPLTIAAHNGDNEIVAMLIAAEADVNQADSNKVTPLINATIPGHEEIVKMLIAAGADVNPAGPDVYVYAPTITMHTPLEFALKHKHMNIARMLIKADMKSALKILPEEEIRNILATNASARRREAIIAHAHAHSRKMRRGRKGKATRRGKVMRKSR